MLKKSMVNKQPPNVQEAHGGGGKSPKQPPKINAEAGGKRVILTEAQGSGHKGTFMAPRAPEGSNATTLGYTKVGG